MLLLRLIFFIGKYRKRSNVILAFLHPNDFETLMTLMTLITLTTLNTLTSVMTEDFYYLFDFNGFATDD